MLLIGVGCLPPTSLFGLADPVAPDAGVVRVQGASFAMTPLTDPQVFVRPAGRIEVGVGSGASVAVDGVWYGDDLFTVAVDGGALVRAWPRQVSEGDPQLRLSARGGLGWVRTSICDLTPDGDVACDPANFSGAHGDLQFARVNGPWTIYAFVAANPLFDTQAFDDSAWYGSGGLGAVWRPPVEAPIRLGATMGLLVPGEYRPLYGGVALFVAADLGRGIRRRREAR